MNINAGARLLTSGDNNAANSELCRQAISDYEMTSSVDDVEIDIAILVLLKCHHDHDTITCTRNRRAPHCYHSSDDKIDRRPHFR